MRIGIDMSCVDEHKTGVGWYTYNLVKNLIKIDNNNEYHILAYPFLCNELKSIAGNNFSFHEIKEKYFRLLRLPIKVSLLAAKHKFDIFHCTYHIGPILKNCKLIITIYDLVSYIFPEMFKLKHCFIYNIMYPFLIKKGDIIIAISDNTKKDLINIFKIKEEKIKVTYVGIDNSYCVIKDKESIKTILKKYNIVQPYILYVGTIEPRKNLVRLVYAFNKFKKQKTEHKLVIVGKKGWLYEELFKTVENTEYKKDIIFTGYVSVKDLIHIYNGADLFIYPSLYEGFGIPPLEAMACGIPVISSNTSSIPEVLGNAALLINPYNVREFVDGMNNLIFNKELRQKYIQEGFNKIKEYSWEKIAERTLKIYNEVMVS